MWNDLSKSGSSRSPTSSTKWAKIQPNISWIKQHFMNQARFHSTFPILLLLKSLATHDLNYMSTSGFATTHVVVSVRHPITLEEGWLSCMCLPYIWLFWLDIAKDFSNNKIENVECNFAWFIKCWLPLRLCSTGSWPPWLRQILPHFISLCRKFLIYMT